MSAEIAEHRAEKGAYLLELQTSQASIRDLEIALQTHNENISTLQQANDELQKKLFLLTEQSEQDKVELQHEVKATQEEKDAILIQLKQSKELVQNLENEVKWQRDELSVQLENNSTLDKQLEELRCSLGAKIAELHSEKDTFLLELQTSQAYFKDLEILLQTHNETISTLQQANCELQKNICTLTNQSEQAKADLQQEVKATQDEMDVVLIQLKQSEKSIQNLENEVKHLKDELSVQQKNNFTLYKQLEEVRCSMSAEIEEHCAEKGAYVLELQTSQDYIRDLEIAIQTHNENILTLQQTNDELRKNIHTLAEQSEQAKAGLQQEVKATQEENDAMLTQLKKSEELVRNLENEVKQLKDQLSVQLENNSTLDKRLEEVRSSMGAEIVEHHAAKGAYLQELQTSKDSIKDLEIALQMHNENISTLQQANDELLKNIFSLTKQSKQDKARLQQEVKAAQEEKEAVLIQLKQSMELVQILENEVKQHRDELSVQLENNFTLDKQLEELRSSMGAKIVELHSEKGASLLELQASQAYVRDLEVLLQTQNENISTLQQDIDELQKNICTLTDQSEESKVDMQQKVKATQEEMDAVLTQLKQSKESIQNLENEVKQFNDELSVQQKNNSTLYKQLEELRSSTSAKIAELIVEKDASLLELQASRASIKDLEIVLQTHKENISTLQQANDELQKNICTLNEHSEQAKVKLQQEVRAIQEEKVTALTQLKQSEDSLQNLENEVTSLRYELSVQLENSSILDKQLEEVRSNMRVEIAELRTEKEISLLESQASQASIKDLEIALQMYSENNSILQQANDKLKKNICTLTEQSGQIKAKLQQEIKATREAKDAVLTQLKQLEESIQNLEDEVTQLKDELSVQLQKNSSLDKQKRRRSRRMMGC
ncbi:unnamed protein product [Urochloa humidicola]